MVYRKPTYEEYLKASEFAKIRYRYGIYIQTLAVFLLLFLLFYTITNVEEMMSHPVEYAEERMGVICNYPIQFYGGSEDGVVLFEDWLVEEYK